MRYIITLHLIMLGMENERYRITQRARIILQLDTTPDMTTRPHRRTHLSGLVQILVRRPRLGPILPHSDTALK